MTQPPPEESAAAPKRLSVMFEGQIGIGGFEERGIRVGNSSLKYTI